MKQEEMSQFNQVGWNQSAYDAWVRKNGKPDDYALKLKQNPKQNVSHYLKYMGDINDKKIANLMGSKGNKAVSFALLGAEVTVVDISHSNKKYAMELANKAGVSLKYIVSDVLDIPNRKTLLDCDYVVLEVGVLHYFVDLLPLFTLVQEILKQGGKFILRDYHPIVSKLINVEENKLIANGNYFATGIVEVDVAYSTLLPEEKRIKLKKSKIRRWTLGEIVTLVAKSGLTINSLEEEAGITWAFPSKAPKEMENNIPGLYTLIASKGN